MSRRRSKWILRSQKNNLGLFFGPVTKLSRYSIMLDVIVSEKGLSLKLVGDGVRIWILNFNIMEIMKVRQMTKIKSS